MTDVTLTTISPGDTVTVNGESYTVEPTCEANNGWWFCITHKESFDNQMQKDIHLSSPRFTSHCLGWFCRLHGPEKP